ncbi:hypothetical protein Ahy_A08g040618 [Arachis hypogaea]|uniref:Uncharacterized protein n=1 Tax=Arachis hypogaea TaxID=3818 RepID=A0A445BZS0_ARAHY|nr:hypothetical protein Ahy_A08g040618 [Arachis hypogaea]
MARNGVTRATTMLILGMFICFAIAEFHNTILEEPLSPLNYYIATADEELAKCIAECNRRVYMVRSGSKIRSGLEYFRDPGKGLKNRLSHYFGSGPNHNSGHPNSTRWPDPVFIRFLSSRKIFYLNSDVLNFILWGYHFEFQMEKREDVKLKDINFGCVSIIMKWSH